MSKFRTAYEPSVRVSISFEGVSRTKQSFKAECDINNILKKYNKTGQLPDMIRANPRYGDFSNVPSYQEALQIVAHAEEQFAGLPAKVRQEFSNDPSLFLSFASDPQNHNRMVEMGLAMSKEKSLRGEDPRSSEEVSPKRSASEKRQKPAAGEGPDA